MLSIWFGRLVVSGVPGVLGRWWGVRFSPWGFIVWPSGLTWAQRDQRVPVSRSMGVYRLMSLHGSVRTTNHSELRNMLSQPINGKKLQLIKGSYCDKLNCSWGFEIQNTSVLGSIQVKLNQIDSSQRPARLHYCCYVWQAWCSHATHHVLTQWKIHRRANRKLTTHRQKRQSLSFQI